MATF
jgi:hypothetical protein